MSGSRWIGMVTGAVVCGLTAACAAPPEDAEAARSRYAGGELVEPLARPDFVLQDTSGEPYDFLAETEGKVVLLFFGYTHCPDICPVHMANIGAVMQDLPREVTDHVEVVFVSVDPDRDTHERLDEWLGRMGYPIVGLRGTHEEVNAVEAAIGLPQSQIIPQDDGTVAVTHAAFVIAFGGDGPARHLYPFGIRQQDWHADIPRLVRETVADAQTAGG